MMMQSPHDQLVKTRMKQAKALSREARGGGLNLGKKISVPKDVMMEELALTSNRGSRMFQERQRRVEHFTLENSTDTNHYEPAELMESQAMTHPQWGKENQAYPLHGKYSLVTTLQKTIASKGSPNVIAPGYSGPLKEIPREKFNSTVIPKSYCSPWAEALRGCHLSTICPLPPQTPQRLQPANYRCFNRAPMPYGGPVLSKRVIPVMAFEALETQSLPGLTVDHMSHRPNFNRAPRGWGASYTPESTEL